MMYTMRIQRILMKPEVMKKMQQASISPQKVRDEEEKQKKLESDRKNLSQQELK